MSERLFGKEEIAELAGTLTGAHLEALDGMRSVGATWRDLVYANVLSLKALALIHTPADDNGEVLAQLGEIVEEALAQEVIGKRFANDADMQVWLDEQGLQKEDEIQLGAQGGALH